MVMHGRDMMHRDVKSHNILIERTKDGTILAKVCSRVHGIAGTIAQMPAIDQVMMLTHFSNAKPLAGM